MTQFDDVADFHRKFDLPVAGSREVGFISYPEAKLRLVQLREEVDEFEDALKTDNLPAAADALVDLVYFALGTAHVLGIPFDEVFDEVHEKNMQKERATGDDDPRGKRGSGFDVVKPKGWTPPNVDKILRRHGWKP